MSNIGQSERATQNRVINLFRDELHYQYLGDKSEHFNSNIEESLLVKYLKFAGRNDAQISRAIYLLKTEANNPNRSLYFSSARNCTNAAPVRIPLMKQSMMMFSLGACTRDPEYPTPSVIIGTLSSCEKR